MCECRSPVRAEEVTGSPSPPPRRSDIELEVTEATIAIGAWVLLLLTSGRERTYMAMMPPLAVSNLWVSARENQRVQHTTLKSWFCKLN